MVQRRPSTIARARTTLARLPRLSYLVVPLLLAGCERAVLYPRGPIEHADRQILVDSVVIMLAIILPVMFATLGFAFWFRAANTRARYLPDFAYSGRIELLVWSIPLLTITLLGGVAWIGSHELDPARPIPSEVKPLELQVVSLDWKWLFIYPDQHVAAVNEAAIPVGVPVHIRLTSASVMNVFFVPRLASMIYTMNGMADQLWLKADQPGNYRGFSAHISGDGFPDMHFIMQALPAAEFADWIANAAKSDKTLDEAAYRGLERQTLGYTPTLYRLANGDLFNRIASQQIKPAPGPAAGTYGVDVFPKPEH